MGGGGGRAWFSRAIVFAIRNKLDWTLDRIPLKYPGRGWANPADAERNGSLCATTRMGPSRENQTLIRWETRATRESCLGIVHLQPPQPRAERFSRDGRRRQWLWLTPGLDWNQTRRKKVRHVLWEHIHFCKSRQRFASAKPRFGTTHAQRRQASLHACMHASKQAGK